mmetsp:Transcript_28786/g.61791  ORF Transcript_28786/g.61791 Transcript_28786/m.61791 type:complete len:149 (-) Transcript_28786:511-957(-)|eukprot:CAMPEP_0201119492 /NCGR_PEP_ID=MMETSP0850-20130426/3628_1 /ASSEMBLY_ACC=CAM_ASM_000622 /TAXON_ID=183588 /ORGANISM="Pseudo-nitzschia fraudulenta, Strain WWA7" /LENGTH=148 /DNA_ID=CAMNT_0047385221 /DNA_START=151 /DNA_END=597 /DNA_ORIENTATION=-
MDSNDKDLTGNKRAARGEVDAVKSASATVSDEHNDFELDPEKRREARKMRRIMANRRSARESRERRKKLLTDLQDSVQVLTTDNTTLTKENLSLRRELATLIEQSGGAPALSMIPNIQSLLESAQVFSNLSDTSSAALSAGIETISKK